MNSWVIVEYGDDGTGYSESGYVENSVPLKAFGPYPSQEIANNAERKLPSTPRYAVIEMETTS